MNFIDEKRERINFSTLESEPQRNNPFKQDEGENDVTRIRPQVNEPQKNDPTRIDIPPKQFPEPEQPSTKPS